MRIYLQRHARTQQNVNDLLHEPTGGDLTLQGKCDALYVAQRLTILNLTHIYASDAKRLNLSQRWLQSS